MRRAKAKPPVRDEPLWLLRLFRQELYHGAILCLCGRADQPGVRVVEVHAQRRQHVAAEVLPSAALRRHEGEDRLQLLDRDGTSSRCQEGAGRVKKRCSVSGMTQREGKVLLLSAS